MIRALWLAVLALPVAAQPKLLVNAQLKTQAAAPTLETAFDALLRAQPQPAWVGWSVPAVRSGRLGCEYVRDSFAMPGVIHLEPADHAVILVRVDRNAVDRIRYVSPDCEIDAGGLPVYWLTDVQPAESVALLASFANQRQYGDSAVGAIAQHADPSADQALDRFLAADQPETLRLRAVTWFGSARGRHGFEVLKRLIAAGDPAFAMTRIREQAVSALARTREPEAIGLLAKTAESDSDVQVRRRAVSALSTLPDGAGIPELIRIVQKTANPDVRKQAMSTLGQSRDPRAVTFFEEVLKK
jgi:hypothetical protein